MYQLLEHLRIILVNSSPTAKVQSYPARTRHRAIIKAVDPDEQLLLTLKTGTPVNPRPA